MYLISRGNDMDFEFKLDSIAVSVFVDFLALANTETALATPLERVQNL